jgi:hypothetical protein
LRTNYEVGDTQRVLDGDLDFIAASLKQKFDVNRTMAAPAKIPPRAAGRKPDHCRAPRQARRLARQNNAFPNDWRDALAADFTPRTTPAATRSWSAEPDRDGCWRMMLKRVMGKASFATIRTGGRIQHM